MSQLRLAVSDWLISTRWMDEMGSDSPSMLASSASGTFKAKAFRWELAALLLLVSMFLSWGSCEAVCFLDDKQVNMIPLISMRACRSSLSWLRSGGETCSPLLPQVLWYFSFQTQPHRCVFAPCVSESVLSVRFSIAVMLFLAFSEILWLLGRQQWRHVEDDTGKIWVVWLWRSVEISGNGRYLGDESFRSMCVFLFLCLGIII